MFLKQGSRYELIGLFRFMFGKETLKTAINTANKYRVNPSEEEFKNTILQSENIQQTTQNFNK